MFGYECRVGLPLSSWTKRLRVFCFEADSVPLLHSSCALVQEVLKELLSLGVVQEPLLELRNLEVGQRAGIYPAGIKLARFDHGASDDRHLASESLLKMSE